jgi:hypothetical protein
MGTVPHIGIDARCEDFVRGCCRGYPSPCVMPAAFASRSWGTRTRSAAPCAGARERARVGVVHAPAHRDDEKAVAARAAAARLARRAGQLHWTRAGRDLQRRQPGAVVATALFRRRLGRCGARRSRRSCPTRRAVRFRRRRQRRCKASYLVQFAHWDRSTRYLLGRENPRVGLLDRRGGQQGERVGAGDAVAAAARTISAPLATSRAATPSGTCDGGDRRLHRERGPETAESVAIRRPEGGAEARSWPRRARSSRCWR